MTTVTALILAGGQSRRMGQDKALLSIGDEALIQRLGRQALACTPRVYVVTPWPDRYRLLLPPKIQFLPEARSSEERSPGPLAALTEAITQIFPAAIGDLPTAPSPPHDWVFALACDLPNLDTTRLQRWMATLEAIAPDILAYLPQHQDRWEPLCGFYRPSCVPSWRHYLATGARSFQGWLSQNPVQAIPDVDPQWLVNLNTPADVTRFNTH